MSSIKDTFNQEYLSKLNAISIRYENKMKGGYSGNRRSKARGYSTEFSDFRDYMKGDDLRRVDWNSFARLHRLFIKIYEEEKQAVINIFLDISKSMDFGIPNKFTYAKIIAASLVYISCNTADRINIYTVNDIFKLNLRNLSSKTSFSTALDYLDSLSVNGITSFENAFNTVLAINLKGSISIIISDFFDRSYYERALQLISSKSGSTYAMQILSPQEINPSYEGGIRFIDSETGDSIDLDLDDVVRKYYLKELNNYNNMLALFFRKHSVNHVFVDTSTPYLEQLWKFR